MKRKLYILIVLGFILLFVTGCENDASKEEKEILIKTLTQNGYFKENMKYVGKSSVYVTTYDATPYYVNYDVYESNGIYYSINFNRVSLMEVDKYPNCDFVVSYTNDVKLVKNKRIETYDPQKNYITIIEDVYETDTSNVQKHCINRKKHIFKIFERYVIEDKKLYN